VFKPGVSEFEATQALEMIKNFLDLPKTSYVPTGTKRLPNGQLVKSNYENRPFETKDLVHEFDDSYGGPVWYIP
jgi:hypothetical protein